MNWIFRGVSTWRGAQAVTVGLAVLFGAGCGSAPGSAASVVSADTQIDRANQTRAEAAMLMQTDFPAAFRMQSSTSGKPGFSCVDGSGLTITGSAKSQEFIRDDAYYLMLANNRTMTFQGEQKAGIYFTRAMEPTVFNCAGARIAAWGSQSPDTTWRYEGATRAQAPAVGDQSQTTRLRFTVTHDDDRTTFFDDLVIVRAGDTVSVIQLLNINVPFDQTARVFDGPTSKDLAQAIADRMQPT